MSKVEYEMICHECECEWFGLQEDACINCGSTDIEAVGISVDTRGDG